MTFVLRLVGKGQPGAFLDLLESETGVCGILGVARDQDDLRATRRASAALRLLKRQLQRRPVPEALSLVARLFPELAELQLVHWSSETGQLTVHRLAEQTRELEAEPIRLEPGITRFFHNLGAEADRRLDLYLRTFGEESLLDTMEKLLLVVGSMEPAPKGILALVSRQGPENGVVA
jgi:hypothetical protein